MAVCERPVCEGLRMLLLLLLLLQAARCDIITEDRIGASPVDVRTTLECHPRVYNHTVTRTDRNGKSCYDHVSVTSCWGRCDSNEISDYRFPYKRSHHPVCIHDVREARVLTLRHCQRDVEPGTERYEYLEAKRCSCQVCRSSEASCEGLRYRAIGPAGAAGAANGFIDQYHAVPAMISNNAD